MVYMHAVVSTFSILAQLGEDAAKKRGLEAVHIVMEITLLIMEKSWKNHGIVFLNSYGNPVVGS